MFAVVVGDMSLDSEHDRERVFGLIEKLKTKYADLVIVSSLSDRGVGKFVRDRCIKQQKRDIAYVEIAVYPWANMPSSRMAQTYLCRNASLMEIGEEFHVFLGDGRDFGWVQDLLSRIKKAQHQPPCTVYEKDKEV